VRLRLQTASLRETTAAEYAQRFVFGGVVTLAASLIADRWGPVIGGIFLAFPGIFPAAVSLVARHKLSREAEAGKQGLSSAARETSVEAAGASAGTWGLVAFALVVWKQSPKYSFPLVLLSAGFAWASISLFVWTVRDTHRLWPRRKK
jgi:hypothetical protein